MVAFTLNGKAQTLDVNPEMPLLWAIRDVIGLTGTKFGCGMAQCGACTVHIDGTATRSCQTAIGDVEGAKITTIEGLSGKVGKWSKQFGPNLMFRNADIASLVKSCRLRHF